VFSTREELLTCLRQHLPELRRQYPIGRLALFGSWARNEAGPGSDVDLMVEVDPQIGLGFVDLADRLEEILGRPVDLVSERSLRQRLWPFVQSDLIDAEA